MCIANSYGKKLERQKPKLTCVKFGMRHMAHKLRDWQVGD